MFAHVKRQSMPRQKRSDFEFGDLVFGLSNPRLRFFNLSGFYATNEMGVVMSSFAATATERALMNTGVKKYPEKQGDFERALLSHPKYKEIYNKFGSLHGDHVFDELEWISRKCKAGLYWASNSDMIVHFILDDIDMDRVVFKKDESITASELRWLYRNKNDEGVKITVKFWKDGGYVPAPWDSEDGKKLWGNYKPKKTGSIVHRPGQRSGLYQILNKLLFIKMPLTALGI